eukprot:Gb_09120 [translate_table: standard]
MECQTSLKNMVPLDYSLHAYLEVIFRDPRMKIYVQGTMVKTRPLAKSLNKTKVIKDVLMDKNVELTLGRSQEERERGNCGIFLYWHGRLIELIQYDLQRSTPGQAIFTDDVTLRIESPNHRAAITMLINEVDIAGAFMEERVPDCHGIVNSASLSI